MKKLIKFFPFFFYVFAFISFILPVVYIKEGNYKIYYNMLVLIFGNSEQSFSIGLFIVFLLFLITIGISITLEYKTSKIAENIAIITGLASGVLMFFTRMLANPNVTDFNIYIGLFLPGIFIIVGTIFLFINKKILNKNGEQ